MTSEAAFGAASAVAGDVSTGAGAATASPASAPSAVPALLELAILGGLVLTAGVTLLAAYRVIRGPTTPDRVIGLDTIGTNVVAIAVLFALQTGRGLFVTVGLVLAIIGFVSTIAVARFVTEGDIIE